jgi:hypothetical protein
MRGTLSLIELFHFGSERIAHEILQTIHYIDGISHSACLHRDSCMSAEMRASTKPITSPVATTGKVDSRHKHANEDPHVPCFSLPQAPGTIGSQVLALVTFLCTLNAAAGCNGNVELWVGCQQGPKRSCSTLIWDRLKDVYDAA